MVFSAGSLLHLEIFHLGLPKRVLLWIHRNYGQEELLVFHIMSSTKMKSAGQHESELYFGGLCFHGESRVGMLSGSILLVLPASGYYDCQSFSCIKGLI